MKIYTNSCQITILWSSCIYNLMGPSCIYIVILRHCVASIRIIYVMETITLYLLDTNNTWRMYTYTLYIQHNNVYVYVHIYKMYTYTFYIQLMSNQIYVYWHWLYIPESLYIQLMLTLGRQIWPRAGENIQAT